MGCLHPACLAEKAGLARWLTCFIALRCILAAIQQQQAPSSKRAIDQSRAQYGDICALTPFIAGRCTGYYKRMQKGCAYDPIVGTSLLYLYRNSTSGVIRQEFETSTTSELWDAAERRIDPLSASGHGRRGVMLYDVSWPL